jgi:hypothetical protein
MAAKIPVKANFTGSDVTSLGEFASSDTINGSYLTDGTVTAAKLAADTATQAELDTVSGVASAALPKAGGTMTGATIHNDSVKSIYGTSSDGLEIYHDGHSRIADTGTGNLVLAASTYVKIDGANGENMAEFAENGAVKLFHNNVKKIETTANGVTVTGTAIATTDTDATNTGSVTLDFAANQNFVLTLTGNVTLANPSTEQVGQSGFIALIQDGTGSRTVSLGTDYETAAAAGLTLTSTASATDLVPYLVVASNRILLGTPQLAFA